MVLVIETTNRNRKGEGAIMSTNRNRKGEGAIMSTREIEKSIEEVLSKLKRRPESIEFHLARASKERGIATATTAGELQQGADLIESFMIAAQMCLDTQLIELRQLTCNFVSRIKILVEQTEAENSALDVGELNQLAWDGLQEIDRVSRSLQKRR
tara:strand:+ start:260 stop:724 length:465 start_codon:yes stop_codon:yes gene_type:complete